MTPHLLTLSQPELYIELLGLSDRDIEGRQILDGSSHASYNAPTGEIDDLCQPVKQLRSFLDTLASVLAQRPGNSVAVGAAISKDSNGLLRTKIYYTFNSSEEGDMNETNEYLNTILSHLRTISTPPAVDRSPPITDDSTIQVVKWLIDIVHNRCWNSFKKRVKKSMDCLPWARRLVAQAGLGRFEPRELEALNEMFKAIDCIIDIVQAGESRSTLRQNDSHDLLTAYARLSHFKILSDEEGKKEQSLLERLDSFLGGNSKMSCWVPNTMKLVATCFQLASLPSDQQLRSVITGNVQFIGVIGSTPESYAVDLSETSLTEVLRSLVSSNDSSRSYIPEFVEQLRQRSNPRDVEIRTGVSIHAEIGLLLWPLQYAQEAHPYIGVSKLSCTACMEYIRAVNISRSQVFTTNGSRGKFYPSWACPPGTTLDVHNRLVESLQEILTGDFQSFVMEKKAGKRGSDSTIGSGHYYASELADLLSYSTRRPRPN